MKTITVFTPTFNRKHTIHRTFESLCRQTCDDFEWLIIDDGSSDGTREWVRSLGRTITMSYDDNLKRFDWMGRVVEKDCESLSSTRGAALGLSEGRNETEREYTKCKGGQGVINDNENENQNRNDNYFKIIVDESLTYNHSPLTITYIYKPNGGLYTGYNVAYQAIQTELCVCIDSDDYMPDDAVEKILTLWKKHYPDGSLTTNLSTLTSQEYCGITGLDFNVVDKKPIGGYFPDGLQDVFFNELRLKGLHSGDTKQVLRTDLMKAVAPMEGFEGEKNFNPIYMMIQVMDKYPVMLMNENLCWVEYQIGADSMSQGIFKQYVNSPCSFAKMRKLEMTLTHNTIKDRFRSAVHYVSSCIIAKDKDWFRQSPQKMMTLFASPIGCLLFVIIKKKNNK